MLIYNGHDCEIAFLLLKCFVVIKTRTFRTIFRLEYKYDLMMMN